MVNEKVLVVDDDKEIVRVIRAYLEQAGYQVFFAYDAETTMHILQTERPALVVLDWMLPDREGIEVVRFVRSRQELIRTYIMMLTARVEDFDKIIGLEVGADDYVTKPFNPREIVARVRAVFRRNQLDEQTEQPSVLHYKDLEVHLERRYVTLNNISIELTPSEFNLLVVMMRRPNIPFTRLDLVKKLGGDYETLERTLDSHIRNLRKKIENEPANPIYIQTVYGVGYRLGSVDE
jgi:two-component system, OmpR family, alkaline phosphatase synthesis response regulator PhoP